MFERCMWAEESGERASGGRGRRLESTPGSLQNQPFQSIDWGPKTATTPTGNAAGQASPRTPCVCVCAQTNHAGTRSLADFMGQPPSLFCAPLARRRPARMQVRIYCGRPRVSRPMGTIDTSESNP